MRLRCFVAMAFERADTDKVFDKLIHPILKNNQVTAIRMDRMEHTGDINNKIIEELKICDFAIADLTYARPSVYFEAGYAQREVTVIYTCRKDHLSKKADENLRVHFDLQMKPIIAWKDHSDREFATRLEKRIKFVIGPLKRQKKQKQIEKRRVEEFAALSVEKKTRLVLDICVSRLRHAGFSQCEENIGLPKRELVVHSQLRFWIGRQFKKGRLNIAVVFVNPSWRKKVLNDLLTTLNWTHFSKHLEENRVKAQIEHIFLCALIKTPISRISTYLPSYSMNSVEKKFMRAGDMSFDYSVRYPTKSRSVPWQRHIYVLDTIQSGRLFAEVFSQKIKQLDK